MLDCYDCMEKETAMRGKDAVIDELRSALEGAEDELRSMRAAAAEAMAEHNKLNEEKNTALRACSDAQNQRDQVCEELVGARRDVAELRAEMEKLKEDLAALQDPCPAPVTMRMVLDKEFGSIGEEGSAERGTC